MTDNDLNDEEKYKRLVEATATRLSEALYRWRHAKDHWMWEPTNAERDIDDRKLAEDIAEIVADVKWAGR